MNTKQSRRTMMVFGVVAGILAAAAILVAVLAVGGGDFLDEWSDWISVILFAVAGLLLGFGRWRQGGWDSVRRVWWLFAFWILYVAARIAGALNLL